MAKYVQVLTTTDSEDDAMRLGTLITDARLAACVQIVGPIRSLYWWDGKVQNEQEWQLLCKTTTEALPALEEAIKTNHSYDVPEVIATDIVGGNPDYMAWISEQTKTDAS